MKQIIYELLVYCSNFSEVLPSMKNLNQSSFTCDLESSYVRQAKVFLFQLIKPGKINIILNGKRAG